MIVEKEAGEIRCCGPRGCGLIDMRYGGLDGIRWCIGATCAGWRWATEMNKQGDHQRSTTVGYCGLAGRP